MDFLTQQLTALRGTINRFRSEVAVLGERISTLTSRLQDQIDSTREARDTDEQRDYTPPVLRAELQVPKLIEVQTSPKNKKEGREWFKLAVETGTLLTIIVYTVITGNAWDTTKESVRQLRRQIAVENRA